MSVYVNLSYRFKRNADHYKSMKELIDLKVFSSYRDIMMLSAIIGFNNGLYVPIERQASDSVQMTTFTETDYNFMDILAYAHKKEQNVVQQDKKYEIFECYANGGYPVLLKCINNNYDDLKSADRELILKNMYLRLIFDNYNIEK